MGPFCYYQALRASVPPEITFVTWHLSHFMIFFLTFVDLASALDDWPSPNANSVCIWIVRRGHKLSISNAADLANKQESERI